MEHSLHEGIRARLKYLRENILRVGTEKLAADLAERGVREGSTNASISRYERGGALPRADYLAVLCELSGCSPNWLLLGYDAPLAQDSFSQEDREMVAVLLEHAMDHPERAPDLMRAATRILRGGSAFPSGATT